MKKIIVRVVRAKESLINKSGKIDLTIQKKARKRIEVLEMLI